MGTLLSVLALLDAWVATANPFTAGSIAGGIAVVLALVILGAAWQVLRFKPRVPSHNVVELAAYRHREGR